MDTQTTVLRPIRRPAPRARLVVGAVSLLALTGCATHATTAAAEDPRQARNQLELSVDHRIAALVPDEIRDRGTLLVATGSPYEPNAYTDHRGELVGFDVDVMTSAAQLMGLRAEFQQTPFEEVLPAVQDGRVDTGASSVTVTSDRLDSVDFVTYFQAGIQWASAAGTHIDPDDACGLRVAVQRATLSDHEDIPARSASCTAEGRPPVEAVRFESQDDATAAAALGQVDAMSADSPVSAHAVRQSQGKMHLVGDVVDAAPYGWPVRKDSELAEALEAAADTLTRTGGMETIARSWGVEDGLIDTPETRQG